MDSRSLFKRDLCTNDIYRLRVHRLVDRQKIQGHIIGVQKLRKACARTVAYSLTYFKNLL